MKYLFVLIFLFTLQISSIAQDQVLTKKGEIHTGKISFDFSTPSFETLTIKTASDKLSFKSYLIEYAIKNSDTIDVIAIDNQRKFGLRKKKGTKISKYWIREESNFDFDKEILLKSNNDYLAVSNIGFRKTLSKFLNDCPVVSEKIQNGDIKTKDLDQVMIAYENCTSETINAASENPTKIAALKTYVGLLSQLLANLENGTPISPELLSSIEVYKNGDSIDQLLQELKE